MSQPVKCVYEFGPFRLDTTEQQLWRDGEELPLTQKAFKLLMLLVENNGHVLDKNELIEKVWPDSFVEEGRLTDNISTLRKALGDDRKSPHYIKTVPGRGYRFVADVREVREEAVALVERTRAHIIIEEEHASPLAEASNANEHAFREKTIAPALPAASTARRGLHPAVIAFACVLGGVLAVATYFVLRSKTEQPAVQAPLAKSIAVLPFKPLVAASADPALEMGMTDALISKLSNIRQITVRPTSSVMKYTREGLDMRAVGAELKVEMLLDGTVQRAGDRIRLSVQLVRVSDGTPMWADKFDKEFTDIFAVQDAIAEKVASALALQLTGEERQGLAKRYTDNAEAYQLYLKGRFHWRTFRMEDLFTSINYYNAALEKDSNYALAYAGMAKSYNVISLYNPHYSAEAVDRARAAAQKAVELDPDLAEAHVALGANKLFAWEWDEARRELERALELDPATDAHTPYGYYLQAMGRPEEALTHLRRTAELAPEWQTARQDVLWGLLYARRYDETAAECLRAMSLDPNDFASYYMLGQTYAQTGRPAEAIAILERGFRVADEHRRQEMLAEIGYVYGVTGERGRAAEIIGRLRQVEDRYTNMLVARVRAGLGERDEAFRSLYAACDERCPFLWEVRVMPQFDSLRSDPRYADLLRRMNLSP